jgi:hypothetical protein
MSAYAPEPVVPFALPGMDPEHTTVDKPPKDGPKTD